jgi:hypothetical protein
VRFQQLEAPKRLDYRGDDGKRRRVSPIRFGKDGHLQDVDWRRIQNATRYTALAQDRFKGSWRD